MISIAYCYAGFIMVAHRYTKMWNVNVAPNIDTNIIQIDKVIEEKKSRKCADLMSSWPILLYLYVNIY